MLWVTRPQCHVDRTACGWLIRRFVDPAAEFLFVAPEEVTTRVFFNELAGGRVIPHDVATMRTRSGEVRTISWSSTPLRDASGRVVQAVRAGDFWILPPSQRTDDALRARFVSMLKRENPTYLREVAG